MKKIFITRRLPPIAEEMLKEHFRVEGNRQNRPLPPRDLTAVVSQYDGILCTVSDRLSGEVLGQKGRLKALSNYAVGLDNIDVEYAHSLGIAVYNTPDVVTPSTADFTFALLLSLIRKISPARDFVRQDRWREWDPELFLGEELTGKTFGILGFGKIGQAVARRALGFGLWVIYYDPFVEVIDPFLDKRVTPVDLDSLLSRSHYISIHASLTEKSTGLINRSTIAKMSKQPVILNLARGPVVDTAALLEALEKEDVRGAALDVTVPEPLPGNHPLCGLENCIVVPHIGTATRECRTHMARLAAQNIIDHFLEKRS